MQENFVHEGSIVRRIWGQADTILFIFAGASAEFALNKAVDWLYYTGKLPSDPIGRLFSTVSYARQIVFAPKEDANKAIDTITKIHGAIETKRGYEIPDWAYRDVLYMLIHYSIAAFELLDMKLSADEKAEVFDVFYRVGYRMGLKELPETYPSWLVDRKKHLRENLQFSPFSKDLFMQYKKHLGSFRFQVLVEAQKLVIPAEVYKLLQFNDLKLLRPTVPVYKISRSMQLDTLIMNLLLPKQYVAQVAELNQAPPRRKGQE